MVVSHSADQLNDLRHLWTKDNVSILEQDGTLDASTGIGCFVGQLGKPVQNDQIGCFQDETGEVAWQMEGSSSGGRLVVTPTGVFVANKVSVLHNLTKYDLQTGNLIWQNRKNPFDPYNPISLAFYNNQVQMVTTKPERLLVLDSDGNTLREITNTLSATAFLSTSDVTFIYSNGVKARRADNNETLWYYQDFSRRSDIYPLVTQDKIFGRSNNNTGTAYALDRNTGKLLWQVHDVIYGSNLAYSPEKQRVYALRMDGNLLAINENTGIADIAAYFSPPLVLYVPRSPYGFELAYDQERHILLVALMDSHQLFAFEEE